MRESRLKVSTKIDSRMKSLSRLPTLPDIKTCVERVELDTTKKMWVVYRSLFKNQS
jgi:hypothetical protein